MSSACRFVLALSAVLILANSSIAYPQSSGRVIFLRAIGGESDSPADVLEKDLHTGHVRTLLSHKSLPGSFKTRIASVSPSPDGKYLYLTGSLGWVFKNKTSGETRTIFGPAFSYGGEEEPTGSIDKSDWCWERDKTVRSIDPPSTCTGSNWLLGESDMKWSPKKNLLLGRRDLDKPPYTNCLYLYDAGTHNSRRLGSTRRLNMAVWSSDGNGVIEVLRSKNESSVVSYIASDGKHRQLFKWPRRVCSVAQSSSGQVFALFDSTGCYILGAHGRPITKLRIPIKKESFNASLHFNRSGSRLAILTSYWYGEPHVGLDQQLWVVNVRQKRASRVARWGEIFQGSGLATERWLEGWLPDQRSVVIAGAISYGDEKPADSENDWIKLWAYDTQLQIGKGAEIFDSGKQCLGVAWYPDK